MDDSEELLSEPSEFEDDENGSRSTPPNLRNDADNVRRDILPDKSEERYRKQLNHFNSWRNDNDIASRLSDNIVLAYYSELRKTLKASSLFSKMAMLKKTLFVEYQFHRIPRVGRHARRHRRKTRQNSQLTRQRYSNQNTSRTSSRTAEIRVRLSCSHS